MCQKEKKHEIMVLTNKTCRRLNQDQEREREHPTTIF